MKRLPGSMQIKWLILPMLLSVLVMALGGCSPTCEEPAMLWGKPQIAKNSADRIRFVTLSNDNAKVAWHDLFAYYQSNDPDDLNTAAMFFNYCWQWNPGNYNAYWGWGIIRGIQAQTAADPAVAETLFNQSVNFFEQAKGCALPDSEADNLDLDLANALTGFGNFYLTQNRPQPAAEALAQAQTLLQSVLSRQPNHGRTYYLLAANCFYRHDLAGARLNTDNAARNNFKVPESFLKELR